MQEIKGNLQTCQEQSCNKFKLLSSQLVELIQASRSTQHHHGIQEFWYTWVYTIGSHNHLGQTFTGETSYTYQKRTPKLDFSRFDGENLRGRVQKSERYFQIHNTDENQKASTNNMAGIVENGMAHLEA
ncbi:uncharacterized protein LOC113353176 [Papaver somniferum]|nr:uncharacterized protein LOC113353176 [Papaver somniferum]